MLGLSMIYGAVKQAGGSIEVCSEVGTGTTFKICLPRVEGDAVKPVKDDRPTVLPGGTETVLLVEDEDIVRDLCGRILGDLGYKVMPARNGAEAIAMAQKYGDRIDVGAREEGPGSHRQGVIPPEEFACHPGNRY